MNSSNNNNANELDDNNKYFILYSINDIYLFSINMLSLIYPINLI